MPVSPPRWTEDQVIPFLRDSEEVFRTARMTEPLERYLQEYEVCRGYFETLLESTLDLATLEAQALDVLVDVNLQSALRYLAGPPVSADDLAVVADTPLSAKVLRGDPAAVKRVVGAIRDGLDRGRFPWFTEDRQPTEAEREAAVVASAALMATQRVATLRRNESKEDQEVSVCAALEGSGFTRVERRAIRVLADAPKRGEFCRESKLGTRKADIVVGMWDGRVMPIEAKVSNSATNSIKRLNNDAAVKAGLWLKEFGSVQIVPAAVLGGVYNVANVLTAQRDGLTLWWAHDLGQLTRYLDRAR